MPTVLIIDDDRSIQHQIVRSLESEGYELEVAPNAQTGLERVRMGRPDLVLLDIKLPDLSGLECFGRIQALDAKLPVVFITSSASSETAIEAMQLGAYDYLVKPLHLPELRDLVRQALKNRRLMSVEVDIETKDPTENVSGGDKLVGRSPEMLKVYAQVGRVAGKDVTVLIRGESGTGKELVARAIYLHSARKDRPFLAVNCAALTDTLLESELFGHEKGSFTGADTKRIGKFEQCDGGTIFLDEIGDMSPLLQSKVLRLLQEQQFERVGGNETIRTDVRIIAATHRDLEEMVGEEEFRQDLLYRINGFTIELPPLRERGDDLKELVEYFLSRFAKELGKAEVRGFHREAVEDLLRYRWPGNIRELQSVIRQSLLNTVGPVVISDFLPDEIYEDEHDSPVSSGRQELEPPPAVGHAEDSASEDAPANETLPHNLRVFLDAELHDDADNLYADTLELTERYLITRILGLTGGNQSKAAKLLGITRGSLRTKIKSLGISIDQVISVDPEDIG